MPRRRRETRLRIAIRAAIQPADISVDGHAVAGVVPLADHPRDTPPAARDVTSLWERPRRRDTPLRCLRVRTQQRPGPVLRPGALCDELELSPPACPAPASCTGQPFHRRRRTRSAPSCGVGIDGQSALPEGRFIRAFVICSLIARYAKALAITASAAADVGAVLGVAWTP